MTPNLQRKALHIYISSAKRGQFLADLNESILVQSKLSSPMHYVLNISADLLFSLSLRISGGPNSPAENLAKKTQEKNCVDYLQYHKCH